jgi:glycerol-3-phosphate O-acyltransferase
VTASGSPDYHDLHSLLEDQQQAAFLLAECRSGMEEQVLARWVQGSASGAVVSDAKLRFTADLRNITDEIEDRLNQQLAELPDETLVIPLRVFWLPAGKHRRLRDVFLGNPHNPGWLLQKLILNFSPDRCSPVFAEPATLGELRRDLANHAHYDHLGKFVLRRAVLATKQVERHLRGHRYKEPAFVENDILQDPEFQADLERIGHREGKPAGSLVTEARAYIKELVPTSTPLGLDLLIRLSRYVYTRGYDRDIAVLPEEVEKLRALSSEHPVILLCNHRSQVDSFAIYSALYDNDLPHPHTFGGINMKWPVIGNIQRSSGMIFIRRAFNDNPVYKAVLQRYIDYLVSRRFPLLWSIEGGRSRTGKLVPPRYGLLHWLLNAAERFDKTKPLYIVPMSVVFEQVIDVGSYAHEQLGGVKKPENLAWFYQYLHSFKTPLGKIHIRFGDPVQARVDAGQPRDPLAVERLAFETCVELNRSTPVTKASLICTSLLSAAPQALTRSELRDDIEALLAYLNALGGRATFPLDIRSEELLDTTLPALQASGTITAFESGLETVYSANQDKVLDAAYYRNNAIHFLFTGAIADMALARLYLDHQTEHQLQQFTDEVLALRKLLQWEFFFPEKEEFLQSVYRDLDIRCGGWRGLLTEGREGLRALFLTVTPLVGHGALEPYLEAYRIVAEQLQHSGAADTFNQKTFIRDCLNTGRQLHLQRQVVSRESIAKAMFETGLKVARSRGLLDISVGAADMSERRREYAEELRAINRRARALRSLASARRAGIIS